MAEASYVDVPVHGDEEETEESVENKEDIEETKEEDQSQE